MSTKYVADIIFIVSNDGLPLLVHDVKLGDSSSDEVESVLIAGFLSAIQSFLKSLTKADLRIIDGGSDKIIIHKDENFSVAAITSLSLVNEVLSVLIEIAEQFDLHYHDLLISSEFVVSPEIFDTFRNHVIELINVDRVITVGSNDIYKRYVSKYAKVGQKYIIENYGDSMLRFYLKLNGLKTMYQILFEENLLGVIRDFDTKLKSMYQENLIQKIPISQKNLQILSLLFNNLIHSFNSELKSQNILSQIKFILSSSNNTLVSLIQLDEENLRLDMHDIKQALEEDPTIALTPEYDGLINPLLSFIANLHTTGKVSQNKINDILKMNFHEIASLYPGDEYIEVITEKLGLKEF